MRFPDPDAVLTVSIRYIPSSTRIVGDGQWPSSCLVRGNALPGINKYLALPRYDVGEHMAFRGCEAWTQRS